MRTPDSTSGGGAEHLLVDARVGGDKHRLAQRHDVAIREDVEFAHIGVLRLPQALHECGHVSQHDVNDALERQRDGKAARVGRDAVGVLHLYRTEEELAHALAVRDDEGVEARHRFLVLEGQAVRELLQYLRHQGEHTAHGRHFYSGASARVCECMETVPCAIPQVCGMLIAGQMKRRKKNEPEMRILSCSSS